ncbi:VanZ family protein [Amycolatopsis thermoflava]|uniref:VanZ family protein n=1 Tax=Amycolatopsis thermoflava TaxID=84480 RepID=UPI00366904AB
MGILVSSFGVLAPVTIIASPFALFAWRFLARRRSRTRPMWVAASTAGIDVGAVLLAALVLALTMIPVGASRTSSLHLVPGSDILTEFTDDGSLWQIAGNLLLLAPLGALLPLRLARLHSVARVAWAALAASAAIELTQFVLHLGRVTSTDDVLLNTLGAAAGATLSCGWMRDREVLGIPAPRQSAPGKRPVGV